MFHYLQELPILAFQIMPCMFEWAGWSQASGSSPWVLITISLIMHVM